MLTSKKIKEYYQALLSKNSEYEGVFYVGVKTTGVFCRPSCPARKPKFENCEFFVTAKEALLASFRPCQRCQPLSHPNQVSPIVQMLVKAIEDHPEKRWKEQDFRALSIDVSTARRQFKQRFGMTLIEYARTRRMGLALKNIKEGKTIIDAQCSAGYESGSGFRDAFSRIMGAPPTRANNLILKAAWLDTQLGPMVALADDTGLYLLEFIDRRGLENEIKRLRKKLNAAIIPGETPTIKSIETELIDYFNGKSFYFKTPVHLIGSAFQKSVWQTLIKIPPGETRSYLQIAVSLKKPTAFRAVALANGANQLAIIVPCHRVINTNGELGGYGGGLPRKQWLLEHEKKISENQNK
ncbi:MAG: bifunctional transcriptional activator/DNA repair protein Ada [Gammaproteobacteria bacterium]|nr:bifunctional transcriptional activator/DNA repair protein Ada [Gammaproteobacteria bacterium]